jgi:hypothetical protein
MVQNRFEPVLELDPVAAGLGHPLIRTGEVTPGIITNAAAAAGCHPTSIPGWLLPCKKYQFWKTRRQVSASGTLVTDD